MWLCGVNIYMQLWNAFENSEEQHPIPSVPQNSEQVIEHYGFNADKFPGFAVSEVATCP